MINKPKGTYDLYGKDAKVFLYLEDVIKTLMDSYNYEYIKTPVFEQSNLFHRGVGPSSDIIRKETYDFIDRGDRNMTLRPEGTASIVRSYIENKFYANNISPQKFWYIDKMYRYERPQKGRLREFFQFGCEAFDSDSPMLDAEIISIPVSLLERLGITNIKVRINSLGDEQTRKSYKEALVNYLNEKIDDLCSDCKDRFTKNPLRILDCKIDKDSPIIKNAPKITDYLTDSSKEHFDEVLEYLNDLEINYEVDPYIIRGLDYYTDTVFEIEATINDESMIICGGGRYDKLVEDLEGPQTKAIGFAVGIERIMSIIDTLKLDEDIPKNELDTFVVPLTKQANHFALSLNQALRLVGLSSELDYKQRSIKSCFKQAELLNAKFIILIGEDEIKNDYVTIKNLSTKEEKQLKNHEILEYLFEQLDSDEEHCCSCHNKDHKHEN